MRIVAIAVAVMSLAVVAGCRNRATVETESKSLTLDVPSGLTITRGETAQLTVKLNRKNFPDPVKVKFENLPDGVKVIGAGGIDVKVGPVSVDVGHEPPAIAGDQETYTLQADKDAALVTDSKVLLSTEGPDKKPVTTSFNVTVKAAS